MTSLWTGKDSRYRKNRPIKIQTLQRTKYVCLSFCRSLCIDYHSLLSCDFNDDWHSALTENRARWPGEHTGKLSGERRMEQTQKSDTSASNREVKVSQATFFRKENTQEISWKEGKDL